MNGHRGFSIGKLNKEEWFFDNDVEERKRNLLEEDSGWLDQWFEMLRPWRKTDLNGRRLVWVSVYGMPPHGRNREKLRSVGGRVGRVVEIHQDTLEKMDMTKGMVLIETPCFELIRKKNIY